jgi:hypothetical protein
MSGLFTWMRLTSLLKKTPARGDKITGTKDDEVFLSSAGGRSKVCLKAGVDSVNGSCRVI